MKSNIGHLEGTSGIAAVIKAILVLESGIIPPNTNFEKINPKIDLEFLNLKVSAAAYLFFFKAMALLTCLLNKSCH